MEEEEEISSGSSGEGSEEEEEEEMLGGSLGVECDETQTIENENEAKENDEDKVDDLKVGMTFNTLEEAHVYYSRYAKQKRFAIAKRTSKKGNDGMVSYVNMQCTRGGKARVRTSNPVRPRPQTKIGCKASINVNLCSNGKWVMGRFVVEHNHEMNLGKSRFYKCNRVINEHVKRRLELNDKAGIGLNKTCASFAIQAGGHENLPFLEKDCRNYIDKVRRLRLAKGDATAMHEYFMRMQTDNSDFFFALDLNENGRLRNVFWADARSRAAFKEFGDVVTFDTTYLVNKYDMPFAPFVGVNHHGQSILLGCGLISHEDTESFVWLFQVWMRCMGGCPPNAIIIDQDKAMKKAIEIVFPNTQHRWCLWHIMKKIAEKLGGYKDYKSIKYSMRNAVYDSLSKEGFEEAWGKFIDKYQLQSNEWLLGLYEERSRWVPACVKDVFWAGMSSTQRSEGMHAYFDGYITSKTTLKQFVEQYENALAKKVENERNADFLSMTSYIPCIIDSELEMQFQSEFTIEKFREFQAEFVGKLSCTLFIRNIGETFSDYEIKENVQFGEDGKQSRRITFTVCFKEDGSEANCNCRLFEFKRILCRHQMMVFNERGIERVPEKYVSKRWNKM